jgi:hypothetical protein
MRHYPRLQRFRLLRRRRCICGLHWPCPDAFRISTPVPIPDGDAYVTTAPSWDEQVLGFVLPTWAASTAVHRQIDRAGRLTPAQLYRATRDSIR